MGIESVSVLALAGLWSATNRVVPSSYPLNIDLVSAQLEFLFHELSVYVLNVLLLVVFGLVTW